jgi:hypothetical protein
MTTLSLLNPDDLESYAWCDDKLECAYSPLPVKMRDWVDELLEKQVMIETELFAWADILLEMMYLKTEEEDCEEKNEETFGIL